VLLLEKPEGPTSHDLVGWVRWALELRRAGHCGTLDPAASGLLVVCIGRATRIASYLSGVDKTYRARVAFGVRTDTGDRDGEALERRDASHLDRAAIEDGLYSLIGTQRLRPPAYSALKVAGERAHRRARRGDAVELSAREMTVRAAELGEVHPGADAWADMVLRVSKGTYLRSLAEELGRRLSTVAHLGALRRLACGDLNIDDPAVVRGISSSGPLGRARLDVEGDGDDSRRRDRCAARLLASLRRPAEVLPMPGVDEAPAETMLRLGRGDRVPLDEPRVRDAASRPGSARIFLARGPMLVVAHLEPEGTRLRPECVLTPCG
jgi:tRNA pseudouridine55 synthase